MIRLRASKLSKVFLQYEFAWVSFWVLAGMAANAFLPVALAALLVTWSAHWLFTGRLSARTPLDWLLLVLGLLGLLSLAVSSLPEKTLPQVYRLLVGIGLYYAVVNWGASTSRLRWIVVGLIVVSLGLSFLSPFSVTWNTGKVLFLPIGLYQNFALLVSDAVNPNVMAGSLVLFFPLALGILTFAWSESGRWMRLLAVIAGSAMLTVLVLTRSRGAWMAVGVVLLLFAALRWRRGWLATPLIILFGVFVARLIGAAAVLNFFSTTNTVGGLDGRLEIWSRSLEIIRYFPFTGAGMGTFAEVTNLLFPLFQFSPGTIQHAHNLFLQIAVDLGIPGLIVWLASVLLLLRLAWQLYLYGRVSEDGWAVALGAGLLGSQAGLLVHGLTDAVTWGMVRSAPLVWAVWGLTAASAMVYLHPDQRCEAEAIQKMKAP